MLFGTLGDKVVPNINVVATGRPAIIWVSGPVYVGEGSQCNGSRLIMLPTVNSALEVAQYTFDSNLMGDCGCMHELADLIYGK